MRIKLLDHGYIELVESWGSDERIVEAARMSTAKGFQGWGPMHADDCNLAGESIFVLSNNRGACKAFGHGGDVAECPPKSGDEKLLAYLWQNKHATPFEMAGLIVEVQAPIFVFREWHRHRTQSYNELSARYTPLPDVNYVPTVERLLINAGGTNKQAGTIKGAEELDEIGAEQFRCFLNSSYEEAERGYQEALRMGVPKELARVHLPVGRYSRMRASANLRNWLAFLTLRMSPNAQWEIRQYANAVGELISQAFPRTWTLFGASKVAA
jgi:thymidylate synthase (FAD)